MQKVVECDKAVVVRETVTPVYVNGSLYTTFRLGDTELVDVTNVKIYLLGR